MKHTKRSFVLLLPLLAAGVAQGATFRLTITNVGPQPLSPLYWSTNDGTFDIFQVGGSSSNGIKDIAESGNTANMLSLTSAAGSAVGAYGVLGGAPLFPGNTRSVVFSSDATHAYFSFATMLGMTNDGFLGESNSSMGLMLFNGGVAQGFSMTFTGARAWDAGTEKNTQDSADLPFAGGSGNPAEDPGMDMIRVHDTIIDGIGDQWMNMPDWSTESELARVSVEVVPEPATMLALAAGATCLVRRRRPRG